MDRQVLGLKTQKRKLNAYAKRVEVSAPCAQRIPPALGLVFWGFHSDLSSIWIRDVFLFFFLHLGTLTAFFVSSNM